MNPLSFLRSVFTPSTATPAPKASPAPARLLAPPGSEQDRKLWAAQLTDAWRLVGELDQALPPSHSADIATNGLPRHPHTRLQPQPGAGSEAHVPMNAHQVGARSIAMDRVDSPASAAFAALCLQKDVRAVMDLSALDAPGRSCMKSNAPWVKGDTRIEFRCRMAPNGFPIEARTTVDGQPATERQVGVYMAINGQPRLPRDERSRPDWNNGADPAGTVMDWVRLPMDSRRAVSPRTLLALSAKADALGGDSGTCVFQSADGGRLAGLCAVAHDLYRALRMPQGRGATLLDTVMESCLRGRANVSHGLLTSPEDVASLIAMARLIEQERQPT